MTGSTTPREQGGDDLREVAARLESRPRLVVTSHVNPDGDAVGSALAMLHAYRAAGGDVRYVQIGDIASTFSFLPGFAEIRRAPDGLDPAPEVLLALDCASADRLSDILDALPPTTTVLNVDHHGTNTRFGDLNLVDAEAAATGEIVHGLLAESGLPLTRDAALCIYVAVVTDTGRFGYSATRPETHLLAAELLRAGVRPEDASLPLYRSQPIGQLRLAAALVRGMGFRSDGRIAWVDLTHETCADAGVRLVDATDMVDVPASVAGVEVAALFRETGNPGETKVSLRSKAGCRIDRIAVAHGGGGHPAAAGCLLRTSLAEARDLVLSEIEEALDS